MFKRILLVALLTIASAAIAAAQTATPAKAAPDKTGDDAYWALTQKYCNDRFGFCVYRPASVSWRDQQGVWHEGSPKTGPENNDGMKFDNGNGLDVTVSGINNASHDTLQSEMSAAEKRFDKVLYREKRKNSFFMKGKKGDVVIFLRTYVGKGSINHLEIQVPERLHASYSEVMSNIAGSFTPGQLSIPH